MKLLNKRLSLVLAVLACLCCFCALAQQSPKPMLSSHARLVAARTAFIEHSGAQFPYDIISEAFRGWGRYTLVPDRSKADLIISINAPVSESGVSVSDGRPGSAGSKTLSSSAVTQIRLNILDAHDRVVLWSGNEQPKSAMKERQREENVVEASLRVFRRFRNTIEPEPAP